MNKQEYKIVKEGYLLKESLHFKQLRKRWVVLNKGYIDFYKDNASLDPSETLDLSKFYDIRKRSMESKPYQFELVSIQSKSNRIFMASSTKDMNDWIKQIKRCMLKKINNHINTTNKNARKNAMINNNNHHTNGSKITTKPNDNHSKSPTKTRAKSNSNINPHNGPKRPIYTEQDIKNISIWYSDELKSLRNGYNKETTELQSHINNLQNELNEMKTIHEKQMEKKLRKLLKTKEEQKELKTYISKLENEFDALQNEMSNEMDIKCDVIE
eukprot:435589_1